MLHESHVGIVRMKAIARRYVWWLGMDRNIEKMVKACEECQAVNSTPAKAPVHPWVWPAKPWQRIHIDYAGPFQGRIFLLIVNAHSTWPEVRELGSTTSDKTIDVLRQLFSVLGLPELLVSDNRLQFASDEFTIFLRQNGVKHLHTALHHPVKPGMVLEKRVPLLYLVQLRNGQVWRQHIDHLWELVGDLPTVAGDAPPQKPPGIVAPEENHPADCAGTSQDRNVQWPVPGSYILRRLWMCPHQNRFQSCWIVKGVILSGYARLRTN